MHVNEHAVNKCMHATVCYTLECAKHVPGINKRGGIIVNQEVYVSG